ncbi:hypothetical protein [Pelomicrobium methylotrophicum]|uniref:Uncharacterized protein n=1 Tax=Pelomicrobium methylotrophicum TaxID=2602750 RepID=A0A5C7EG23_9PROT|nr:hypothetical protein [Pelomicrobium methylotrophicum]TXF11182.1 hypothetical protein FR698_11750 [Pelomicrobium methylotrophicum]
MRIVVVVTETGSPELYKALQGTPARQRAERLRTLATVGLVSISAQVRREEQPPNTNQDNGTGTKIGAIAKKLGGVL